MNSIVGALGACRASLVISFTGRTKVYAATEAIDLRKSFDSLYAFVRDVLKKDPLCGHVFVFINRKRDRLKALLWDGSGLVLIVKRLEDGKFTLLNRLHGDQIAMTAAEFALLFEGADLNRRFVESPKKFKELHP
jgi:transposase